MLDVERANWPGRPAAHPGPVPLLFLIADTGGGHRAAAAAVAEAVCCGAPILLMSHLPGQERGGVQRVTRMGAGRHLPRTSQLVTAIGQLKEHRADLAAMRAVSGRLGRPDTADRLAAMLDGPPSPRDRQTGITNSAVMNACAMRQNRRYSASY